MNIQLEDRWHAVKQSMKKAAKGASAFVLACALMFGAVGCASADTGGAPGASAQSAAAAASDESASVDARASDGSASGASSEGADEQSQGEESSDAAQVPDSASSAASGVDESLYDLDYSDRDKDASYDESSATSIMLKATGATVEGSGAQADAGVVTITQEGVYVVSGTLDDGQIVVDAPEDAKVQIVLADAHIANADGSAIYVKQADKCFITLADGTANSVEDGETYVFDADETEPDAAIFSTCDLTLQGSGSLQVSGNYNDGIKTKDDLTVTGGTITVSAKGDGMVGKDSVKVADGDITVKALEGDGIKSSKDDDEAKGFVSIDGGTIAVDAADKGIKAETYLRIAGGTIDVTSGDDALHSDGSGRILGGQVALSAGDDAFHVERTLDVDGGAIDVSKSYEGLEGQVINMNDGVVHVVASDDGLNASPVDGGSGGMGGMDVDESCVININGGLLVVESGGDGIDSNGSIVLNGGIALVSGPTSNGDGALDSGTTITANGGTLIAAGSSGMAEGFTDGAQAFGQVSVSGNAGDTVAVTDSDGNVLASYAPTKAFQNVVVTADGMQEGSAYQVVVGAAVEGADEYGYTLGGTAQGGTASEFTATTEGSQMGFGGMGGFGGQDGQGGMGGFGPQGGQRPDMPRDGEMEQDGQRPDGSFGGRGHGSPRADMPQDGNVQQDGQGAQGDFGESRQG